MILAINTIIVGIEYSTSSGVMMFFSDATIISIPIAMIIIAIITVVTLSIF